MFKEKRDLKPLWIEFGVAVALSFAGFLYSRHRTRQTRPYLPPRPSLRVSGLGFFFFLPCVFIIWGV